VSTVRRKRSGGERRSEKEREEAKRREEEEREEKEGRGERRGDTASLTLPQWKKLFIQLITIIVILINNDFSNGPNYD
jgi:hypothetical protein